jgi:hypothetical protein
MGNSIGVQVFGIPGGAGIGSCPFFEFAELVGYLSSAMMVAHRLSSSTNTFIVFSAGCKHQCKKNESQKGECFFHFN